MGNILVIDDDLDVLKSLGAVIKSLDHEAWLESDPARGLELLEKALPDVVITDMKMPRIDGLGVLERIQETKTNVPVIVITGHGNIPNAVEAMRRGAFDYISKPFGLDQLEVILKKAMAQGRLKSENILLRQQAKRFGPSTRFVGESKAAEFLLESVDKVAPMPTTVLIRGEHGVGKEIVARRIHERSDRRDEPFVIVDCGALAPNILESELFGHVKGAFTGAEKTRKGYFEVAGAGSVFLDEVAELPLSLQPRLLRVLQTSEFSRVGETQPIKTQARIIAATNRDLEKEVEKGSFREDLYYRLNVFMIEIPPLRKRIDDVPPLTEWFIDRFNRKFRKNVEGISPDALQVLMRHPWRGNVRELENLLERVFIMKTGDLIEVEDLPESLLVEKTLQENPASPKTYFDKKSSIVENLDKQMLVQLLKSEEGNISRSARRAGMHRSSLQRLIRKHRINPDDYRLNSGEGGNRENRDE